MNVVYMPETCIGENIYRKRIIPLQDVKTRDLKEVPKEAKLQFVMFFCNSNLDMIYNQEFVESIEDKNLKEKIEKIKTLMRTQYIKENLSEFESEVFLNGKAEVFYVSKNSLGKDDEKIGTVSKCNWYNPIRAIRISNHIGKCSEQYAGDFGFFQTELDVEFAVWHNNVYYFF